MAIKVLIVDDEPINVKLIEEILKYEEDFQYRTAANGHDALATFDTYQPDIVILDIMMPGMNGYEVCKRIKTHKSHKFAKVLMLSGKAMIEERLEGYAAGADDYITKPFVDDELLAKMKVFSRLKKTEEVEALKTAILQLFSHETKTPLNGILLGSQLILDTPTISEKIAEYATLIKLSGERIHELVRKILLLSSLKNNPALNLTRQSVPAYLRGIVSQTDSGDRAKHRITITCPTDFNLEIDWHLFHKAFSAVIENGLKYSPQGEEIKIEARVNESFVYLRVSDKGPGIDPARRDKIFDAFYSQRIANHTQGTALSLAISKEIMKLHNGDLCVDSNTNQGSTFIFTLPSSSVTDTNQ